MEEEVEGELVGAAAGFTSKKPFRTLSAVL